MHTLTIGTHRQSMYTVLLTTGTVGTTATATEVGDVVTVTLHDANGVPISETGTVAEILEVTA